MLEITITKDSETMKSMQILFNENREIYNNIRRNVDACARMYLCHQAEQEFITKNFVSFNCYAVLPQLRGEFNKRYSIRQTGSEQFLLRHKKYDFAAMIMVSKDGYICDSLYYYDFYAVEEMVVSYDEAFVSYSDYILQGDKYETKF